MYGERVLLLIPHPDDELVGTATAIGRLRRQGGEVFGAYLTSGVPASAGVWFGRRQKYRKSVIRRWEEANRVAEELGLSVAGRQETIPSRELKAHIASSVEWIQKQALELKADRLWVPAYEGGHQDHDVANFIAAQLARDFDVWEFAEYHFGGGEVQSQTFLEPNGSEKALVLDPSEKARKRALLAQYDSEQKNLGYVGIDREVFRPLAHYDYGRAPHAGRMFFQRFRKRAKDHTGFFKLFFIRGRH